MHVSGNPNLRNVAMGGMAVSVVTAVVLTILLFVVPQLNQFTTLPNFWTIYTVSVLTALLIPTALFFLTLGGKKAEQAPQEKFPVVEESTLPHIVQTTFPRAFCKEIEACKVPCVEMEDPKGWKKENLKAAVTIFYNDTVFVMGVSLTFSTVVGTSKENSQSQSNSSICTIFAFEEYPFLLSISLSNPSKNNSWVAEFVGGKLHYLHQGKPFNLEEDLFMSYDLLYDVSNDTALQSDSSISSLKEELFAANLLEVNRKLGWKLLRWMSGRSVTLNEKSDSKSDPYAKDAKSISSWMVRPTLF